MKILEKNLQECLNEVVLSDNKEDTIYWLGRIHAFMKMADEHNYELSLTVKLEKCKIEK